MASYIEYIPGPFLKEIMHENCVPFIGAGFSLNAKCPPGSRMPLWDDVGQKLKEHLKDYQYRGPLDAISAYEHEFSRVNLVQDLMDILLINTAEPGETHRAFAELPFNVVCTTNLDFLLERSYEGSAYFSGYRPIIDEDQLAIGSSADEVRLVKIHGDLHHPQRLIVTESDYDGFLHRYPLFSTYISSLLIGRTALFIGYSLDDPDFRQLWHVVGERLGRLRKYAYALTVGATDYEVARYERRGVKVINLPGDASEYPQILTTLFKQLYEKWHENFFEESTVPDSEPQAELSLPSGTRNRLCFFDVPIRLLSVYKSLVFPLATKYGFLPIADMDVLSPTESVVAKITALVERSEAVVIHGSRMRWDRFKPQLLSRKQVLVIKDHGVPADFQDSPGVQYIEMPFEGAPFDALLEEFDGWFKRLSDRVGPVLVEEPERLLKAKEYRAAVVSAISVLEMELRLALDDSSDRDRRFLPGLALIEEAIDRGLVDLSWRARIQNWWKERNLIVHERHDTSAKMAADIVKGTLEIVSGLRSGQGRTA